MVYTLRSISNRINRIINIYSQPLILQINSNNKGNQDYINVGLLSLFIVGRDLIKNSIRSLGKNDYYSSNILIRKVFENSLVFIRLYDNSKLEEYFQLCKDLKPNNVNLFNKDEIRCKKCKFRDLSNIDESRKHFANINSKINKQDLDSRYKLMCEYTHFNLLKIGQYKHHLQSFDLKKIDTWSYDFEFHKETLGNIMLAFENLIYSIEHVCKSKSGYDKNLFDKIYSLIKKNRKNYENGTPP